MPEGVGPADAGTAVDDARNRTAHVAPSASPRDARFATGDAALNPIARDAAIVEHRDEPGASYATRDAGIVDTPLADADAEDGGTGAADSAGGGELLDAGTGGPTAEAVVLVDALLGRFDEIAGVIGLLFLMAYFRNDAASAWHLPRTAWLFVTVGLGVLLGVLIFAAIRLPRSNAEFLAIVLGAMAFASGFASVLRLSSTVICFIAGTLITNFPNDQRESVFRIFHRLERPIYLLFLMISGALWSVFDWRGWALVPLFVASRIVGKWLGVTLTRASAGAVLSTELSKGRRLVLPMSPLAIALVVSIERFQDIALNWVVTAVIGSSLVMELFASPAQHDDVAPTSRNAHQPEAVPPAVPPAVPIESTPEQPEARPPVDRNEDDG